MRRPEFNFGIGNFDARDFYNKHTEALSPGEKKVLNGVLAAGVATPVLAGTIDMFSGPENVSNSYEHLENAGLTALVPGLTSAGMGYAASKMSRPIEYADRTVFGVQNTPFESNVDQEGRGSANDYRTYASAAERKPVGMGQYAQKYGLYEGAKRLKADHAYAVNRRRNLSGAFGAGIGAIAGGSAASQMMMDEYPSVADSLSMQDRQELVDLLGSNGAL